MTVVTPGRIVAMTNPSECGVRSSKYGKQLEKGVSGDGGGNKNNLAGPGHYNLTSNNAC